MNIKQIIVAAVAAVLFAFGAVAATDLIWTGGGDGESWNEPANWGGVGTPSATTTLVFNNGATTVNNMGNITVYGIKTAKGATTDLTIGGTGTLTIGAGVIKNEASANIYFDCPVSTTSMNWNSGLVLGPTSDYGVYFRGGFTGGQTILYSDGAIHFEKVPFSITRFLTTENKNRVYLSVAGNTISGTEYRIYNSHLVYFQVEDALIGPMNIGNVAANSEAVLDLGGYNQTKFTNFKAVAKSASIATEITSTDKANIVLEGDGQYDGETIAVRMTGKAGLVWNPSSAKTITFGANSQTTKGDLGVLNGTLALADGATFTSLEKLTVGRGGTFKVLTGGGEDFHADDLEIHDGATFDLAAGVTLRFDKAKLIHADGTCEELEFGETYDKTTMLFTIVGDGVICIAENPDVQKTTARWDAGGASDTSINLAANWEGDETPDLVLGGLTATFAAGSAATVNQNVKLMGVAVASGTGNFNFEGSGDFGMKLLAGGLTVEAGSAARTVAFKMPVTVAQPQTWTVAGASDVVSVGGGLSGVSANKLSFTGRGKLKISGKTDYAGQLVFMPTAASTLSFENADFAGMVHVGDPAAISGIGNTIAIGGENIVRGRVNFRDRATMDNNGRIAFAGGIQSQFDLYPRGSGTYVITNSPFMHTGLERWFSDAGSRTELWAEGNAVSFVLYNSSRLDCRVPGALLSDFDLRMGVAAYDNENRCGILYMTGDQGIGNFITYPTTPKSVTGQRVYAETLSALVARPNADRDCYASFFEAASFKLNAAFTYTFHYPSSSTGSVEVAAGKVVFADKSSQSFHCDVQKKDVMFDLPGGSWVNASKVTVGGGSTEATLELTHGKTFGKQTVLNIQTNGKVRLNSGVREHVGELWLGGVKQSSGIWGSSASGAQNVDDAHFVGEGQVVVGKLGLILVVQ